MKSIETLKCKITCTHVQEGKKNAEDNLGSFGPLHSSGNIFRHLIGK